MSSYPILPHPKFLSPPILNYISEIGRKTGRYIVFCNLPTNPYYEAQIQGDPNFEGVAIFLQKSKINPTSYSPLHHDPIIAHEVTHLELWATGWSQADYLPESSDRDHFIIRMFANLLTDPLINTKINNLGFHIHINRENEIVNSINTLPQGIWALKTQEIPFGELMAIRLFVSFSLEPHIPLSLTQLFQERFRTGLPLLYDTAHKLLQLITQSGFDTPTKYKTTFYKCLQFFGLRREYLMFREPFIVFDPEECQRWAEQFAFPPEDKWE